MRASALCALALFALGCAGDVEELLPAESGTTGELGKRGAYGVGLIERSVRARVDDVVDVEILMPLDASGELADGSFPVVVFVHGGLVPASRYRWITRHVASRGNVVIAPAHSLDLAIFQTGNALDALEGVRALADGADEQLSGRLEPGPVVAMGHSLGGVIAADAWLTRPDLVSHLVLLSSEPAPDDDFTTRPSVDGARVVSIVGTRDGLELPEEAKAGAEQIEESGVEVVLGLVDGMNHFQFTEDATTEELGRDLEPTRDLESARALSLYLVDATVDAAAGRPSGRALDDPSMWPAGLLTYERYQEASQ